MKKEEMDFVIQLINKIEKLRETFRNNDCKIQIKDDSENSKEYYTINFELRYCNSEYKDCIVFYLGEDFDAVEILKNFDKIQSKAFRLLKD